MKRRAFLSVLGAAGSSGVVGCLSSPPSSHTEPATTVTTDRATTTISSHTAEEEIQRSLSLDGQDSVPDRYDVRIDVEILESTITDTHTGRVCVTTTNTGARRAFSIGGDRCELFNRDQGGSDDPAGLWLHDPEKTEYIDRKQNQWVADKPADESRAYLAYGCSKRTYEAGESLSNEYVVWDDYRVSGYLTPGTYRWEETVSVSEETNTQTGDNEGRSFTWGFSLRVEYPDS